MTRADDPWKDVGGGRRLDGKISSAAGNNNRGMDLDAMTEDEMLQMAMMASLEQDQSAPASSDDNNSGGRGTSFFELTEEPGEGAMGAVKIQFRLPDGTRAVRRFLESEQVGVIYAFVESKCFKQRVELRAGFPPKDLGSKKEESIKESNLAGEMIHGRYV